MTVKFPSRFTAIFALVLLLAGQASAEDQCNLSVLHNF